MSDGCGSLCRPCALDFREEQTDGPLRQPETVFTEPGDKIECSKKPTMVVGQGADGKCRLISEHVACTDRNGLSPVYAWDFTISRKDLQMKAKKRLLACSIGLLAYVLSAAFCAIESLAAQSTKENNALTRTRSGVRRRILQDLEKAEAMVKQASLGEAAKAEMLGELKAIRAEVDKSQYPQSLESFRAIMPLNDLHRRVFKVYARLLQAGGTSPITIWHTHPYAMLPLFAKPMGSLSELKVAVMLAERRAEVINVTNATGRQEQVRLQIEGLPGGTNPKYIKVHRVEQVDTQQGVVVGSALVQMEPKADQYTTTAPAGMTRQIWLSIQPQGIKPGTYRGRVAVTCGSVKSTITLELFVAPMRFPDQVDCSLGLWDYVTDRYYAITAENQQAAVKDMAGHFVDTVWCTSRTLPLPLAKDVDADGNLTGKIDFSKWDAFVKMFPNARYHIGFAGFGVAAPFAGKAPGTKEFDRAVAQWASAWARHNAEIGLKPSRVALLSHDEPRTEAWMKVVLQFSKAFKAGTNEILLFSDPIHFPPDLKYGAEAMELNDIICPLRYHYTSQDQRVRDYYQGLKKRGKILWLYMCSGPTRMFNPGYFRLQPWHCFLAGATGSNFWSYGDAGKTNSWNEYTAIGNSRPTYTPVYIAPDSITTSKHWEATREGLQDYQYLRMLEDFVTVTEKAAGNQNLLREARQMIDSLPKSVINDVHKKFGTKYEAKLRDNPSLIADRARLRVLEILVRLQSSK